MSQGEVWARLIHGDQPAIHPARAALVTAMKQSPWAFFSARDPFSDQPLLYTKDESHPEGKRPWPDKSYLRELVHVLSEENVVFVEKSRQMIVSTACCLYAMWDCLVHENRRWLVSRSKESDAIELLRDKIRAPWNMLPKWLQELFPMTMTPSDIIRFPGTLSLIQAVTENVANRTARGGTASGIIIDEAAYQDQARDIYAAAAPMATKLFVVSTPSIGLGGQWMRRMIARVEASPALAEYEIPPTTGGPGPARPWAVRRAEDGYVVVTLSYAADPDKNTWEWFQAARSKMPDEPAFQREYLISWTSSEGQPVFAEFATDPKRYVDPGAVVDSALPVLRGWDFGIRSPACIWLQVQKGRVVVLRELVGSEIDIHSFRDLVMYLSGQELEPNLPEGERDALRALAKRPQALEHLRELQAMLPWWPDGVGRQPYSIPFFEPGLRWEDYSGPEATQRQQFESMESEKSCAEVLASRHIYLRWNSLPVSYGENLIRKLLLDAPDGRPGILIHPQCTRLIEGLQGALTYRPPSKVDPKPNTMARPPGYIDIYDAFRYAVINAVDITDALEDYKRRSPTEPEPEPEENAFPIILRDWRDYV